MVEDESLLGGRSGGLTGGGILVHTPSCGVYNLAGLSLPPFTLPSTPKCLNRCPSEVRAGDSALMGARLPERPTPPPPPASGVPQVLVVLHQCKHCNQSVGGDDVAGICQDCWEELEAESMFCLSVTAVRYLDYVLKQVNLKLKAKTKNQGLEDKKTVVPHIGHIWTPPVLQAGVLSDERGVAVIYPASWWNLLCSEP